jgi:hypothetical protein
VAAGGVDKSVAFRIGLRHVRREMNQPYTMSKLFHIQPFLYFGNEKSKYMKAFYHTEYFLTIRAKRRDNYSGAGKDINQHFGLKDRSDVKSSCIVPIRIRLANIPNFYSKNYWTLGMIENL